jgi:ankyrin repeat protein
MPLKRDLYSTNLPDDLAALRRRLGNRVKGTCEWILDCPEFQNWLQIPDTQLLRLVGEPGIGKSMISSFLVGELEKKCRETQNVIFAYYFFDNKDEDRRKAVALLRTLLLQLLRQRPSLFQLIEPDYEQMGQKLMENFDALWRILILMLEHLQTDSIWILIDAMDECDQADRGGFLQSLGNLIIESIPEKGAKVKFVLTCRPEDDIQDLLNGVGKYLQIDKGTVNNDLKQFIEIRINEVSKLRPHWDVKKIKEILNRKVGGTFLWVALVLKEIMEPGKTKTMQQVQRKLEAMPTDLYKIYDRILREITEEDLDDAKNLLHCVIAAKRPLHVAGLTEAHAFMLPDWPKTLAELEDAANNLADSYKICGSLLFVDTQDNTVNFIHQSAKDYLLSPYLQQHSQLASYHIVLENADLSMFESCWRCLSLTDLDDFSTRMFWEDFEDLILFFEPIDFLSYAAAEWENHVMATGSAIRKSYIWEGSYWSQRPLLRDAWLRKVSASGQEATVRLLLENGADANAQDDDVETALILAARNGHEKVTRLLLENRADVKVQDKDGYTALIWAARNRHEAVTRLLLDKGADVNVQGKDGYTALIWAAENGHEAVTRLLLEKGADVNVQNTYREIALIWAARNGHEAVTRLLLEKGADVNVQNTYREIALIWAARNGHEAVTRLLLEKGADVNVQNTYGETALIWAARNGHEAVTRLLLEKGADMNMQDNYGATALTKATVGRHKVIERLLSQIIDR